VIIFGVLKIVLSASKQETLKTAHIAPSFLMEKIQWMSIPGVKWSNVIKSLAAAVTAPTGALLLQTVMGTRSRITLITACFVSTALHALA